MLVVRLHTWIWVSLCCRSSPLIELRLPLVIILGGQEKNKLERREAHCSKPIPLYIYLYILDFLQISQAKAESYSLSVLNVHKIYKVHFILVKVKLKVSLRKLENQECLRLINSLPPSLPTWIYSSYYYKLFQRSISSKRTYCSTIYPELFPQIPPPAALAS